MAFEGKRLKGKSKKGSSYGTLSDYETRVYVDEKLGLLEKEVKYVSEGEVSSHSSSQFHGSSRNSDSYDTHRSSGSERRVSSTKRTSHSALQRSGSGSSGSQNTSRSASQSSYVASYKGETKKGGYDLWNPRSRSRSLSCDSDGSGSSDEIYSRFSASSTHCHDIIRDQPEDRLALAKLMTATLLSLVFMLLEYVGGYYSSSLAVLSDAGHLLSDFCGYLVSLVALCLLRRPASVSMSFGYYRAEVLGSVVSVLIVWVVTGLLVGAAVQRILLYQPYTLEPDIMVVMAAIGIIINIAIALVLHGCGCGGKCSGRKAPRSLSTRTALLQVMADTLQTIAVFIAAIIVKIWPAYQIADPILTFVFGFIVVVTTLPILRELAHILMEGAPRNMDYFTLLTGMEGLPGVRSVHNLHIWSLTLDKNALSVHLVIDPSFDPETVLDEAQRLIRQSYFVSASTIQIERYTKEMEACKKCQNPSSS